MVTNGIRVRLHQNLNIHLAFFLLPIGFYKNTHHIPNFIGDILNEFLRFLYAYHTAFIVNTYQHLSAMCIGKATYPFQILIAPCFFVLYVVILAFHT